MLQHGEAGNMNLNPPNSKNCHQLSRIPRLNVKHFEARIKTEIVISGRNLK